MEEVRKKQINQYYPGCIIYRYNNDELIQARIIEYKQSQDWFNVYLNSKLEHLKVDDVLNNWILLSPDAIITINIVKLQQGKDLMVCVHPLKEMNSIPTVICRQSIVDVFSDMAYKISPEYRMSLRKVLFVGMCVTEKTCPADIDYRVILSCESVENTCKIGYYIEDDLENIFLYIKNTNKYNKLLRDIKTKGLQSNMLLGYNEVVGYNETLKELLVNTGFLKDVRTTFNMVELPFEIYATDAIVTSYNDIRMGLFTNLMNKEVTTMYITKYDRSVNLDDIERDYVIGMSMNSQDLYIIGYDIAK